MPSSDDADLIREGLRAVLRSENTSGKALEAKAAAARQLAKMEGLMLGNDEAAGDDGMAPDPFRDLELVERARQAKIDGRMTAREFFAFQGSALDADERELGELERRLVAVEARRPKRAARRRAG
jgi:hypothetical protein